MKTTAPKRPALRYHGGKWRLAPWIISHFPPHRVYVEPYGGGASVLLRKKRSHSEVYNDIDGRIVNLFRVLQDQQQGAELLRLLTLTPFSRDEFNLAYEPSDDPIEQARKLIIKSQMGHAGEGINRKTGFRKKSTSSGKSLARVWSGYPESLALIVGRMRGVIIENRPAEQVIINHDDDNVLIYCDPPYVHDTRKKEQTKAYKYEMSDKDHENLSEILHGISGVAIVSGYPGDLYNDLYSDWEKSEIKTKADAGQSAARERTEVLWMNAACVDAQQQKRLF